MTVLRRRARSPFIYLLLAVATVALLLGERSDAMVILAVVVVNSIIGSFQEGRAARSIEALRALASVKARVRRDGGERILDARELVPGDVLLLAAGNAITADARVIDAIAFDVAEAALTGESVPVSKTTASVAETAPLADRRSMVYSGTHVTGGRATAVVVATGLHTEVGRIARLTAEAEEPATPGSSRSCATRASFFARVHLLNWRSRRTPAVRLGSDSAVDQRHRTSARGERGGCPSWRFSSRCGIGCLADVERAVPTAEHVHEMHDDAIVRQRGESNGGGGSRSRCRC